MFDGYSLQKKMFLRVWCITCPAVLLIVAGVLLFERNRLLDNEYTRIYNTTLGIKKNLVDDTAVVKSGATPGALENVMHTTPGVLYFIFTDQEGRVLASDNRRRLGKKGLEIAKISRITHPLFEKVFSIDGGFGDSRFVIYTSRLKEEILQAGTLKAKNGEMILEAFWDMSCCGSDMGTFRMGFSRQWLGRRLYSMALLMIGSGFGVLILSTFLWSALARASGRSLDRISTAMWEAEVLENAANSKMPQAGSGFHAKAGDPEEIQRLSVAADRFHLKAIQACGTLDARNRDLQERLDKAGELLEGANLLLAEQTNERKEIETRLLNSQKLEAVGTLAGGVAHEFNNLFMAITGYAALIRKQAEPGHPNAEKASKIVDLVNTGARSINQLLGFARSGKYAPGVLNINEVIQMALEMFKKTRKDIEVQTKYTKEIWEIFADRSQMEHVVMNLLLNASEAMPSTGMVKVGTGNILLEKKQVGVNKVVSGRFVHFYVQDQGRGIDPKHLSRIFDPFFTTKPISAGTGLGLASVYGIVDNHDGFATVESSVGQGTVINVFLPVRETNSSRKDKTQI